MERKSFIYLDGREVKHTYDEANVYFVNFKGDIFYYIDIDNTTFAWYGQAWFEINKQELIKYRLDDIASLVNHLANNVDLNKLKLRDVCDIMNKLKDIV